MKTATKLRTARVEGFMGRYKNLVPIDDLVPNAETLEAIQELRSGGGVRYKDTAEMFADLGIAN